jgi:hypothetical protein
LRIFAHSNPVLSGRAVDAQSKVDAERFEPLVNNGERVRVGRDKRLDLFLRQVLAIAFVLR